MKHLRLALLLLAVSASPSVHAHKQLLEFSAAAIALPTVEVVDQRGLSRPMDQLIAGKQFVLTFQFADCKTLCPATNLVMASLDQLLADHKKNNVLLISVTLAPEEDTPARLSEKAAELAASPSWLWLTGKPDDLEEVNRAFGLQPGDKEQHEMFFVIGHSNTGKYLRVSGLPTPKQLYDTLENLPD